MDVAFRDVFLVAVLAPLVLRVLVCHAKVSGPFIRIDGPGIASRALTDEAVQDLPIRATHLLKADVPTALHGTEMFYELRLCRVLRRTGA